MHYLPVTDAGASLAYLDLGDPAGPVAVHLGGLGSGPREYISGALSNEDLEPLRDAGCRVRVVAAAGHVLMWDNLPGFATAIAAALRAHPGE